MLKIVLKKRIPTILGIFLLLIGIAAGVYLVELGPQPLTTKAGPEYIPNDVRITNISESSFTVSWSTDASALGLIKYGTSPSSINLSAFDVRDSGAGSRVYSNHYVTASNLETQTAYYFEIVSGSDSSTYDDNGTPYSVTTAPAAATNFAADTAYGAIYFPDLTPADGSLVYISIEGGSVLSSLVSATGAWTVPLSSMRTADLTAFLDYDRESEKIAIEVVGPDGSTAQALVLTANDTPVEDIVLGKSHDFTTTGMEDKDGKPQFSLEPLADQIPGEEEVVKLDSPSEGENIYTQLPEFLGGGPPGTSIEIIVESEPIQGSATVDASGQWAWSPDTPLEPGEHTLTLKWADNNGVLQTLTRRFVVYAQDEFPAFEASPSATPTPVAFTATPTPTLIPTVTPTATPTLAVSPTPVATEPSLPVPGTGTLTIWLAILGITLLVSGTAFSLRRQPY